MKLSEEVIDFFKEQGFVNVVTLDSKGQIHISIKGIIDIEEKGKVYLLDLYQARTFKNLKQNPTVTISAVDEHLYEGYALQGKAEIIDLKDVDEEIHKKWEKNIAQRISKRLMKNVKRGGSSLHHPEVKFPYPKYLILLKVEKVIDLTSLK
jgi:uncharacterized pyridoxamine 5'-phosphate oxidase family protein